LKAVVLAAGSSTRLYPLTIDTPKCLLEVGGQTLIEHQLDALALCDVSEIVIVTGYLSHLIEAKIEAVKSRYDFAFSFVSNSRFATTNNIYSLAVARDSLLGHAFLCLHADVLFHTQILQTGARSEADVCLIADREVLEETMKLKAVANNVLAIGKHITVDEASGTFLGIAKFSAQGGSRMFAEVERLIAEGETNLYFTAGVERLIAAGFPVRVEFISGLGWIEIDFAEELAHARAHVYDFIQAARR
jgi:choline kinase